MEKLEFLELLIEDLEIEEKVDINTNFRELEDWCSLMGFSMLVFISENFSTKLSVDEFLKLNTFEEVYNFVK